MADASLPLRLVHLACIHCGEPAHDPGLLQATIRRINDLKPDLVLVAGDVTFGGYEWEYAEAAERLAEIDATTLVAPGDHDARNVGYLHFERHFGERFYRHREPFDAERAERLRASGVTVVTVDSSEPDLEEGRIGREWYGWIEEQFSEPEDIKVFLVHHHLVSIPGAGRALNVVTDAGDLLTILSRLRIDLILTGHRHVPFFWGLNGMLLCNAGTTATRRLRGQVPPSWSELRIDASTIKVHLNYPDGRRQLAAIRMRPTVAGVREAFHITERFYTSNHVPAV